MRRWISWLGPACSGCMSDIIAGWSRRRSRPRAAFRTRSPPRNTAGARRRRDQGRRTGQHPCHRLGGDGRRPARRRPPHRLPLSHGRRVARRTAQRRFRADPARRPRHDRRGHVAAAEGRARRTAPALLLWQTGTVEAVRGTRIRTICRRRCRRASTMRAMPAPTWCSSIRSSAGSCVPTPTSTRTRRRCKGSPPCRAWYCSIGTT